MGKTAILAVTAILTASSSSGAIAGQPNSNDPVHCIAAYFYAHQILLKGPEPDRPHALGMSARMVFESIRLKRAGKFAGAFAQAEAFLKEHVRDQQAMMSLLKNCGTKLDANSDYQAGIRDGSLISLAEKLEQRQAASLAQGQSRGSVKLP